MKIRFFALFVAVAVASVLLVPFASAAQMTGTAQVGVGTLTVSSGVFQTFSSDVRALNYTSMTPQEIEFSTRSSRRYGPSYVQLDAKDTFTGNVGIYFSYFFESESSFTRVTPSGKPSISYVNANGVTGTGTADGFSPYEPSASSNVTTSKGYNVIARYVGTEEYPISSLRIEWPASTCLMNGPASSSAFLKVPSFRVISTETSAELDALQSMADEIAVQSDILNAMYGDLVAVCNSIYQATQDIKVAQDLANTYLSDIARVLGNIDDTSSRIYDLLDVQFQLLISTIQTESDDIQGAIAKQTADIIAYLDNAFSGSVGQLPGQTDNLQGQISNNDSAENNYKSDASTRFNELSATFTGFSGGALSGVSLVSTLFTRVWSVLGEWVILYTFPLYLGLALLIIGRLGRHSSRSSSDKDGDTDA